MASTTVERGQRGQSFPLLLHIAPHCPPCPVSWEGPCGLVAMAVWAAKELPAEQGPESKAPLYFPARCASAVNVHDLLCVVPWSSPAFNASPLFPSLGPLQTW